MEYFEKVPVLLQHSYLIHQQLTYICRLLQVFPVVEVPGHLEEFTTENVRNSVMNEVNKLF